MGPEILTVEEMAQADAGAVASGVPSLTLMEAAGEGVVREIRKRWTRRSVLVLAGPGNNGGDGFVIARRLKALNWPVRVQLCNGASPLKGDAKQNADLWDGPVDAFGDSFLEDAELIIDAVFGAGLKRDVSEAVAAVLQKAQNSGAPIVAVDMPSGVDGNTGEVRGHASPAVLTVTFFRKKPGHLILPGRGLCGEIVVKDIGIPPALLNKIAPLTVENGPGVWSAKVPKPDLATHKYARGHLLILGGDKMTGAAQLAAGAARRVGAGLVSIATPPEALDIYRSGNPGNLIVELADADAFSQILADNRKNCVLIGPGSGVSHRTRSQVISVLKSKRPVVLDADALTVFKDDPEKLFSCISGSGISGSCVLTPHEGEFDRLFDLRGDKLSKCRDAAKISGAVVLLKGADTVIADPTGAAAINGNAPAFLATAGSGDVLAGIIGGLLTQGMTGFEAAAAGAWMHGAAGTSAGDHVIAEDLANHLPSLPRFG